MRVLQEAVWSQVTALAYSPDGSLLAVGGSDGLVRLWCPFSGRLVRTCHDDTALGRVTSLSFRPDGVALAAGAGMARVNVWDTDSGALRRQLSAGPASPGPDHAPVVLHRPDGQRLVGGQEGLVTEWTTRTFTELRVLRPLYAYMVKPVRSLAFGPESALAVGEVNTVYVWRSVGTQVHAELNWPEGDIVGLHFLPGQEELEGAALLVARGRDVGLFYVKAGNHWQRARVLRHADPLRATALSSDGRRLLSAGDDWTVHVWDTALWQKVQDYNFRLGPIRLLAVAPDGMTAAAAGTVRPGVLVWDLE